MVQGQPGAGRQQRAHLQRRHPEHAGARAPGAGGPRHGTAVSSSDTDTEFLNFNTFNTLKHHQLLWLSGILYAT